MPSLEPPSPLSPLWATRERERAARGPEMASDTIKSSDFRPKVAGQWTLETDMKVSAVVVSPLVRPLSPSSFSLFPPGFSGWQRCLREAGV